MALRAFKTGLSLYIVEELSLVWLLSHVPLILEQIRFFDLFADFISWSFWLLLQFRLIWLLSSTLQCQGIWLLGLYRYLKLWSCFKLWLLKFHSTLYIILRLGVLRKVFLIEKCTTDVFKFIRLFLSHRKCTHWWSLFLKAALLDWVYRVHILYFEGFIGHEFGSLFGSHPWVTIVLVYQVESFLWFWFGLVWTAEPLIYPVCGHIRFIRVYWYVWECVRNVIDLEERWGNTFVIFY